MDNCNVMCGAVYEPFWDQCGGMLMSMGMGGMDEMGEFYDNCLEVSRARLPPRGLAGALSLAPPIVARLSPR